MRMRLIISLIVVLSVTAVYGVDDENDFDDFDMYEEAPVKPVVQVSNEAIDDSDDGLVEDEFDPFSDKDEFEFGGSDNEPIIQDPVDAKKTEPKLTMAKVPMNFRNWDSYWIEMLCCAGLIVYFVNYTMGKSKNIKIANSWLSAHKSFLEENFALVGDDYKKETDTTSNGLLMKDSDSIFTLWCSGRVCCEGMLTELKLIKRQDLLSLTMGMLSSKVQDQVVFKAEIGKDSTMDGFVFAVCNKKVASKMLKDMPDIKQFCVSVAKADEKYNIPTGFSVLSELAEASSAILDNRVVTILNKYSDIIESIHISDQFSGPQPAEQAEGTAMKLPETKKMVVVSFNMPEKNYEMEDFKPMLQLVIYLVDKLKRFKLSREGKIKSEKNRSSREQEFLKSLHSVRMEAAAQKVSEKRKQEKEKLMMETDVDKQMKLEKKMKRKESKKAMPKTKSMSINL